MSTIMVASAKGGVGKSTLCVGLGKIFAEKGHKTLLVDMDIGVRSLDLLLNVAEKTVYNWGDVILNNCDPSKALIGITPNLSLLPAPLFLSEEYTAESVKKLVECYKDKFEFIILDAPAGVESGFKLSLKASEKCIIVSTPDPVSIRAASSAASLVRKNGINDVRLVLNRFNKKQHKSLCVDDVVDSVTARFLGIVPESNDIALTAIGEELPYDSKGNMAYLRITKRLLGENVPFRIKNI
ncbi:MAG: AAA family ATPase [Clostridia bacterium]|nr:AAA family ATPase [Clostridia bacterium]MBR3809866.1 AAA family ATPase [Clostridia bacterium]